MCKSLVPLVVVNASILSWINDAGYSNGELPYCNPGATFPSLSPAVMQLSMLSFMAIQSSTDATGITNLAPLCKAAAIVEVANTNFDYKFKFKQYEMEDVNQADSIAITFTEGILGYIVIRDYHLISNP